MNCSRNEDVHRHEVNWKLLVGISHWLCDYSSQYLNWNTTLLRKNMMKTFIFIYYLQRQSPSTFLFLRCHITVSCHYHYPSTSSVVNVTFSLIMCPVRLGLYLKLFWFPLSWQILLIKYLLITWIQHEVNVPLLFWHQRPLFTRCV